VTQAANATNAAVYPVVEFAVGTGRDLDAKITVTITRRLL